MSYGLPTDICDADEDWYAFVEAYCGVIKDGSLCARADKHNVLGAVKQVTFTKGKDLTADHHVSFVIQWNIELKDGRALRASVQTVPAEAGNMTAYHIEVINGTFVPPEGSH
jgi:hypothetical protein